MRVLLDENLPHALAPLILGHDVLTVQGLGWAGLRNGDLLREAQGRIDAFVTMDTNLEYQQRLVGMPFGIAILHAPSNRVVDLSPLVPLLLTAFQDLAPGDMIQRQAAIRFVGVKSVCSAKEVLPWACSTSSTETRTDPSSRRGSTMSRTPGTAS